MTLFQNVLPLFQRLSEHRPHWEMLDAANLSPYVFLEQPFLSHIKSTALAAWEAIPGREAGPTQPLSAHYGSVHEAP